jgi:hypothetical protein
VPKFLSNVTAQSVPGKGWKPASVGGLFYSAIKSGDNKGAGRLSIQYTISEGKWEGENVFGGGNLAGGWARVTIGQLMVLRPDVDWNEYDFPEPPRQDSLKNPEELAELLIGRECWIKVEHRKYNDEDQAEVKRIAPADTDLELDEDDD